MKQLFAFLVIPLSLFSQQAVTATTVDLNGNCCVQWYFNKGTVEINLSDEAENIGHLEPVYIFEEITKPKIVGNKDYYFIFYNMFLGGNVWAEGISLGIEAQTGDCTITYSPDDDDYKNPTLEFKGKAFNY